MSHDGSDSWAKSQRGFVSKVQMSREYIGAIPVVFEPHRKSNVFAEILVIRAITETGISLVYRCPTSTRMLISSYMT